MAKTLHVEYASVMELLPDGATLRLVAVLDGKHAATARCQHKLTSRLHLNFKRAGYS